MMNPLLILDTICIGIISSFEIHTFQNTCKNGQLGCTKYTYPIDINTNFAHTMHCVNVFVHTKMKYSQIIVITAIKLFITLKQIQDKHQIGCSNLI